MVATAERPQLKKAVSLDLECEFHEDQTLLIRFWGVRDQSTGRWDLVGADALCLWVDLPGAKRVPLEVTESGNESDSEAMLREARKHWERAEQRLEEDWKREQQVAFDLAEGAI